MRVPLRLREYAVYWVRRWRNKGRGLSRQSNANRAQCVLLIDDRVPDEALGSGFPRSCAIIEALLELGWGVTFYQTSFAREPAENVRRWSERGVEVVLDQGIPGLRRFLRRRRRFYDVVIVSRPHNMARAKSQLFRLRRKQPIRIAYDAEAVFSSREILRHRITGTPLADSVVADMKRAELELAVGADAILTVSEMEGDQFRQHKPDDHVPVFILPHVVRIAANPPPFEEREGFLFVGALQDENSPNTDAIRWFLSAIFPAIRERLNNAAKIEVVGTHSPSISLRGAGVVHVGRVTNLGSYYGRARIFIAPSRFAAGVPLKIYEAAGAGIPVVATSLLAGQLGWIPNKDLIVADQPNDFADACVKLYRDKELWRTVQGAALAKVERDCSAQKFKQELARAMESSGGNSGAQLKETGVRI